MRHGQKVRNVTLGLWRLGRAKEQPANRLGLGGDLGHACAVSQGAELERTACAHPGGVPLHHAQIGANMGREVSFIDDQHVRAGDRGATLAGDFLTRCHVNDIERDVCQFG